ncbi:serine carboxypeptidase [Phellopilus nigrolimitatus]|nr:serine carboxypeptidase [Phellopilus nigrolimitatus]
MKLSGALLASLLVASSAGAIPVDELELQTIFSDLDLTSYSDAVHGLFGDVAQDMKGAVDESRKLVLDGAKKFAGQAEQVIERHFKDGMVRNFIKQHGITYELLQNQKFDDYQMRVTEPKLCDPGVQQYSGYLDISDGKHLFFWFFESRTAPEDAPLILWLNGGPGCSSSTGLLFELGPCSIANDGNNVTYNPHSWNSNANIIFLDQPVNVGFSYSSDGSSVNTSPVAGEDVYAFLELFLTRYPKYAEAPFHIAAESYGGTYVPNFANTIYKKNKELALAPQSGVVNINLASVMIGNGITNPYIQDATIPEFACDGPYPIYDDPNGPECTALRGKVPTCQRLIQACYKYNSRLACVPAALYCNSQLYGPIQQSGRNPYDVRKTCDPAKDTSLCYRQMGWIETWMNEESNKKAVGADPTIDFSSCNMQVNQAFMMQGDGMHNSAPLLTDLVNDGIRLLIYAGNADYMCNFIGNEAWVAALDTNFREEFTAAEALPWVTLASGKIAGSVRTAGANEFTAGNVTFVTVHEAGHMVPYDQPEAALDLLTRWIYDVPLADAKRS